MFDDSKMAELHDAIRKQRSSAVWLHYANLIDTRSGDGVPLDIHRAVLRACAPPPASLRAWSARRQAADKDTTTNPTRVYETRFRAVLRNIRARGSVPALDDYHVILAQFAAVGNDVGAVAVFRELLSQGVSPSSRTYGLVLRAVAHGLTLPDPEDARSLRIQRARETQSMLLSDMQARGKHLRTVNFDLMLRVLKEVNDPVAFTRLLRWGYGIDLDNPDCLAPEYQAPTTEELSDRTRLAPHRFSTALLNTTIDLLGRSGDVSRMVAAFEVLTRPLPARAPAFYASSFDDEDDFGPASSSQPPAPPRVPCPRPNTTTYTLLVRHTARAQYAHLAKHYVQEALAIDVSYLNLVRSRLKQGHVPSEFRAPRVSATRDLLYAAFGHANRSKDSPLGRWVHSAMAKVIKRKEYAAKWFTEFKERVEADGDKWRAREKKVAKMQETKKERRAARDVAARAKAAEVADAATAATASTSTSAASSSRATPSAYNPDKRLDLDVQIGMLERELQELKPAYEHVGASVDRVRSRILERGGRRVWDGKDVFVRDANRRVVLSKERWTATVKFPKGATGVRVRVPRGEQQGGRVTPGMWQDAPKVAQTTGGAPQAQAATNAGASLSQREER